MSYIGNVPTSVAFVTDQFSGTGSQTAFTMSVAPANTASVLVAVSGVLQDPSTYSVSGTTLTFSAAPPSGTGNISARYLGIPASGVTTTAYRTVTEFTATAGQTTFTPPSYTAGYINVYRNGVRLGSADYTATNGTTVVLATGATAGDIVTVESYYVSSVVGAIPATAGAVTDTYLNTGAVTQTKLGTNVAGNGPAFSVYNNTGVSVSSGVTTKLTFNTEEWDTNNNFASSRFTPTVAGYYVFTSDIGFQSSNTYGTLTLYKNGSAARYMTYAQSASGALAGSCMEYANGTTDYFELYINIAAGQNVGGNAPSGYFQGAMVRAA